MPRLLRLSWICLALFPAIGWSQGADLALPEGTRAVRDIAYIPDGHERQKLDVFVPPGEGPRPLLVWVHGGAWKQGSKDRNPAILAAHRGCIVAGINYRLSQHAHYPAQIQDCQAAIRWLRAHAKEYSIDTERVAVWGASAGGHLVSLLGTASDSKDWDAIGPHQDQSARVQAVIDWFGPSDFTLLGPLATLPDSAISQLLGATGDNAREKFRIVSPVTYVTADDAPFLIVQGDQDKLVHPRQSERLHEVLQKAGVKSELVILPGAGHGGAQFLEQTQREKIAAFLAESLREPAKP